MTPTREIYWNIVFGPLVYLFAAAAIGVMSYGIYQRVRLWRLGGGEMRTDNPVKRLWGVVDELLFHRRMLRDTYPGLMHLFIFYGFFAELIATSMIAVQEWTGIHYLKGNLYLGYSLLSDGFGLLGIVGILMALWRRLVVKPERMNSVLDDYIALWLLLLVFVQGFAVEGLRIAATELRQNPALAPWSPGGYAVALTLQGLSVETLQFLHRINWWFHAVTAFVLLGYMGFGKFNHIWYGLLNMFCRNLDSSGKLSFIDIEATMESDPEAIETLGVEKIEGYTWKSLLDLDACTNCGRCQDVCPAYMSGVPLSPKKLIQDMQAHLSETGPAALAENGETGERPPLFGEPEQKPAVLEEELWGCRTCGACQQECPVFIEHIPENGGHAPLPGDDGIEDE